MFSEKKAQKQPPTLSPDSKSGFLWFSVFFLIRNPSSEPMPVFHRQVQIEETIVKVPKIMQTVQHLTVQDCDGCRDDLL